jgi:hypothetical protein
MGEWENGRMGEWENGRMGECKLNEVVEHIFYYICTNFKL